MVEPTFRIEEAGSNASLAESLALLGFPESGVGNEAGYIAVNYILETQPSEQIASIWSDQLSDTSYTKNGLIDSPIRIYTTPMVCGPDGTCNQLVVATSDTVLKPKIIQPFVRTLFRWIEEKRIETVVNLGSFRTEVEDTMPQIVGAACTKKGLELLDALKVTVYPEGILRGMASYILYEARLKRMNTICLLAKSHADYREALAAAAILSAVRPLVPVIPIDTTPLVESAREIEGKLRRNIASFYIS